MATAEFIMLLLAHEAATVVLLEYLLLVVVLVVETDLVQPVVEVVEAKAVTLQVYHQLVHTAKEIVAEPEPTLVTKPTEAEAELAVQALMVVVVLLVLVVLA